MLDSSVVFQTDGASLLLFDPAIAHAEGLGSEASYQFEFSDISSVGRGKVAAVRIGGDGVYGLIDTTENGESMNQVPIGLLESDGEKHARVIRDVARDQVVTFEDIELPDSRLVQLFNLQQEQIGNGK